MHPACVIYASLVVCSTASRCQGYGVKQQLLESGYTPQVGMALGPGDWDSQLVTAAGGGDMRYTDFRLVPGDDVQPPGAQASMSNC